MGGWRTWLGLDYVAPEAPETNIAPDETLTLLRALHAHVVVPRVGPTPPAPILCDCGHRASAHATERDGTTRCLVCHAEPH